MGTRIDPGVAYTGNDLVCPTCGNTLEYDGTNNVPLCEGSWEKPHTATLGVPQEAAQDTGSPNTPYADVNRPAEQTDTNSDTFPDSPQAETVASANNPSSETDASTTSETAEKTE